MHIENQYFPTPCSTKCLASFLEVNQVASMYGRPDANIADMFNEQPLYVNKKKRLAWERQAGKQYPGSGTPSQGKESIPGPEDVVKWAEDKLREQGKETHSLRAGDFQARVDKVYSDFARTPEKRLALVQVARQRVQKELDKLRAAGEQNLAEGEIRHAEAVAKLREDLEADEARMWK